MMTMPCESIVLVKLTSDVLMNTLYLDSTLVCSLKVLT